MTAAQTDRRGWENILDADEHILWQGRPDPTLRFAFAGLGRTMFGAAFAGFALFWMTMAAQGGGFFWMFGLIHFFAGIGVMGSGMFWPGIQAHHTWYSLSNQRAFIATDFPWSSRRLNSYPITDQSSLSFEEGPLTSIFFASEDYRRKGRTQTRRIGFERISDGRSVYNLMRDIQRTDRQETHA